MSGLPGATGSLGEAERGPSLEPAERVRPCPHRSSLLNCRKVNSCGLSPLFVMLCNSHCRGKSKTPNTWRLYLILVTLLTVSYILLSCSLDIRTWLPTLIHAQGEDLNLGLQEPEVPALSTMK